MPATMFASEAGYHRCQGERAGMTVLAGEVDAGTLCTNSDLVIDEYAA